MLYTVKVQSPLKSCRVAALLLAFEKPTNLLETKEERARIYHTPSLCTEVRETMERGGGDQGLGELQQFVAEEG